MGERGGTSAVSLTAAEAHASRSALPTDADERRLNQLIRARQSSLRDAALALDSALKALLSADAPAERRSMALVLQGSAARMATLAMELNGWAHGLLGLLDARLAFEVSRRSGP